MNSHSPTTSGSAKEHLSADPSCPICFKSYPNAVIEAHVNRCIFLNSEDATSQQPASSAGAGFQSASSSAGKRRNFSMFQQRSPADTKKPRLSAGPTKPQASLAANAKNRLSEHIDLSDDDDPPKPTTVTAPSATKTPDDTVEKSIPLSEKMRPETIDDYVGQTHIFGADTILRKVLDRNEVPSMILWGPPGCGKTTLAHIIAKQCKRTQSVRFVKLSATMVGVNDVKEVVQHARNEQKFHRKTILFMDEIHRFNKLQQDIFLPHVESGTITLIGATTENPSFSLNAALLSRCRVLVLEKLDSQHMFSILKRSLSAFDAVCLPDGADASSVDLDSLDFVPRVLIDTASVQWLADMCDGDARIGLNSLQLAMQSVLDDGQTESSGGSQQRIRHVRLDAIKEGIRKSHFLYDRKGDQHYDMISALHKSIRASDDNAALYWCCRMMAGGEDPRYICRRMVRAASEDIGLADPQAVNVALSALNAVQLVGMPEADCILAQCAVYLARAPKSTETYVAMKRCRADIEACKGPQPGVPLALRNAPTKLMKELGYGRGYNMAHRDVSGLHYLPEGMEDRDYFT